MYSGIAMAIDRLKRMKSDLVNDKDFYNTASNGLDEVMTTISANFKLFRDLWSITHSEALNKATLSSINRSKELFVRPLSEMKALVDTEQRR